MGESAPLPLGHWVAGAGALGMLVALFLPWYELNVPDELVSQANAVAAQMGEFGPLVTQGIAELERAGGLTVTAFEVFESADLVLAAVAAAVLAAVVLGVLGPQWIAGLGIAAAGLVLFKLGSPPGASPYLSEQLLEPEPGMYFALACAVAMVAGGAMSMAPQTAR